MVCNQNERMKENQDKKAIPFSLRDVKLVHKLIIASDNLIKKKSENAVARPPSAGQNELET